MSNSRKRKFGFIWILMLLQIPLMINAQDQISSEVQVFSIEVAVDGFTRPSSMAFLSSDQALVGDRDIGKLSLVNLKEGSAQEVTGLPTMLTSKSLSAGILDIVLHPEFEANGWIYICYAVGMAEASGLKVDRFRLSGNSLIDQEPILTTNPLLSNKWHFGGRMVFSDSYLFVSVGDGYAHSALSQDGSAHTGKILRINDDGSIPADNPFVGQEGVASEIWAYGIRNSQGMTIHPKTGELWISEHGPQGGDEINIVEKGKNYGWPVISYGEEYGGGPIGKGITHHADMEQPIYYYTPSTAPSGIEFYTGDKFPAWSNSVFVGALALTHINRLVLDGDRVLHEERLLDDKNWRIRFVKFSPDGFMYFGADDGRIRRLVPATKRED